MSSLWREVLKQCLRLGIATVAAGLVSWCFHPRAPLYDASLDQGQISLASLPADGRSLLWVDARTREEFEQGHIPGALLLNEDDWHQLLEGFFSAWSPEKLVIVYCGAEGCQDSKLAAQRLKKEMQITNVYVLKEGWEGWQEKRQSRRE